MYEAQTEKSGEIHGAYGPTPIKGHSNLLRLAIRYSATVCAFSSSHSAHCLKILPDLPEPQMRAPQSLLEGIHNSATFGETGWVVCLVLDATWIGKDHNYGMVEEQPT
jgi:hypothetical protein